MEASSSALPPPACAATPGSRGQLVSQRVGGTAPVCSSLTSPNFYLNERVLQRKKTHNDLSVCVYIEYFFSHLGGSVEITRVVAQQLIL